MLGFFSTFYSSMNPGKSITKKDHVTLKTGMLLRLFKIQPLHHRHIFYFKV